MLTLAMPQSEPAGGEEPLGLALVGGEDRRRKALRDGVVQRDRLVEGRRRSSRRGSARTSRRARSAVWSGIDTIGRLARSTRRGARRRARGRRRRGRCRPAPAPARARLCMRLVRAAAWISGPTSVPSSQRGADRQRPYAATIRSVSWSATEECTNRRRRVVQRWPAVPAAANTTPRRARSRSADGATMAPLLPPSSSRVRPKRAATTGADLAAHPDGAGGRDERDPWVLDELAADRRASVSSSWWMPLGAPGLGDRAGEQRVDGDGGERGDRRPASRRRCRRRPGRGRCSTA